MHSAAAGDFVAFAPFYVTPIAPSSIDLRYLRVLRLLRIFRLLPVGIRSSGFIEEINRKQQADGPHVCAKCGHPQDR